MKICIVQRVLLFYRIDLFTRISKYNNVELIILHGEDIKGTKFLNYKDAVPFKHIELSTKMYVHGTHKALIWFKGLQKALDDLKPDVLILEGENNMLNNIRIGRWSKKNNIPFLWWSLGLIPGFQYTLYQRLYHPFLLKLLDQAKSIIGYSSYTQQYYHSLGISSEKVIVCNNCLDYEKIDIAIERCRLLAADLRAKYTAEGQKLVLYVGNIEKRKRLDTLIQAFAGIPQEKAVLFIVGDGSDKANSERMTEEIGLQNVVYTGSVYENVSMYFSAADLFVLPSLGGLSIYQAMVHRLPVICGSADGTERDLVRSNGLILDQVDSESLRKAIVSLLDDPAKMIDMGNESRRIVEDEINQARTVENMMRAINSAISSL